jgi:hypothetical protein
MEAGGGAISYRELHSNDRHALSRMGFDPSLTCPICKRFRVEWEFVYSHGTYNVCQRCSDYVHEHGIDDDIKWCMTNVVDGDDITLRWETPKSVREGKTKPLSPPQ